MQIAPQQSRRELIYGWYSIEVFARPLGGETFVAHGCIRHAIKNPLIQDDLPYECGFNADGETHQTVESALTAGISFARKMIDSLKAKES